MPPCGSLFARSAAIVPPREPTRVRRMGEPFDVADTTLAFDTTTKASLYARHGIPEVWVLDVRDRAILACRDAFARNYRTTLRLAGDQRLSVLAIPELAITPRQIFGD